jgi:hypothetical protein
MTGNEYADLIAAYVVENFGGRGIVVYREVSLGKTIIGKNRHVDILVIESATNTALAIECKYQDSSGTVDEKIPYAIQDMQAMSMPVCLTYAGSGFSDGILHMLAGCPIAAYCLPSPFRQPSRDTRELDVALALAFRWWDVIVYNKKPFSAPPQPVPLLPVAVK